MPFVTTAVTFVIFYFCESVLQTKKTSEEVFQSVEKYFVCNSAKLVQLSPAGQKSRGLKALWSPSADGETPPHKGAPQGG